MQLNVIDTDGNLTTVVYPGKQVALEIRTSHQNHFGVPTVKRCSVSNPLQHDNAQSHFSQTIFKRGCGVGSVLTKTTTFRKGPSGYTTPFFPVPPRWTIQTTLLFACRVMLCTDHAQCSQSCPPVSRSQDNTTPEDLMVLMESQVVTSCPQKKDGGRTEGTEDGSNKGDNDVLAENSMGYMPHCFPEEHRPHAVVPLSDNGDNATAGAAESDINKHSSLMSFLTNDTHYVIIIGLLVLMICLIMLATFCKMAAVQRQVKRYNKQLASADVARSHCDQHDQETQTPTPAPRAMKSRTQKSSRASGPSSRDNGVAIAVNSRDCSQFLRKELQSRVNDSSRSSPSSTSSETKLSLPPKSFNYDIPPSHDHQTPRTSVSALGSLYLRDFQEVENVEMCTLVDDNSQQNTTTGIETKKYVPLYENQFQYNSKGHQPKESRDRAKTCVEENGTGVDCVSTEDEHEPDMDQLDVGTTTVRHTGSVNRMYCNIPASCE